MKSDGAVSTAAVYITAFIVGLLWFSVMLGWQAAFAIWATMAAGALCIGIWSAIRKARHRRRP
jgi:membrane protein implicated in regulation of membrane protease activity